jgi:NitT/TauT family transport system ATP-binding protein
VDRRENAVLANRGDQNRDFGTLAGAAPRPVIETSRERNSMAAAIHAVPSAEQSTAIDPRPVVIEGDRVTKVFAETVVALEGATFTVPKGSFVSLVGPSGCGKSTLLRLVAGLIPRSSGRLTVHGEEVTAPRKDIGMMFQKATLLDWRTAAENVLLPSEINGRVTQKDRKHAIELLELVGLKGFEFSFPRQLSGGMQQRVALARLLQTGADILLLDEPFGALDEFTRERLNLELLRIVAEVRSTTLFVTHNIAEAIFLADQVLVMTPRPGRLAAVVDVPFARPREIELQLTPEFNALVSEVRGILGSH